MDRSIDAATRSGGSPSPRTPEARVHPTAIRVHLVEDHPVMRATLSDFLAGTPGVELVGAAATGEEAVGPILEEPPDLVIVDLSLPGMNGLQLVGELRATLPGLPCLILSGHGEPAYAHRALAAGARGYVVKGNPYEMAQAIRAVMAGEVYVSESIRDRSA